MTNPLMERCLKVEYINGYRCDEYHYKDTSRPTYTEYDADDDIYVKAEECAQCLEIISGAPRKVVYAGGDDEGGVACALVDYASECYNNASFSLWRDANDCRISLMNIDSGATYIISTDENIFWFIPDDYTVVRTN